MHLIFNFFIKNSFEFNPNQIDIKEFTARGAHFSNKTFSINTIIAYDGEIYKAGDIVTDNAQDAGVARRYFFYNDNIIENFKNYN